MDSNLGSTGTCVYNYEDKGCGCTNYGAASGPDTWYYDYDLDGFGSEIACTDCCTVTGTAGATCRTVYEQVQITDPIVLNNDDDEPACFNPQDAAGFAYRIDQCGICNGDGYSGMGGPE